MTRVSTSAKEDPSLLPKRLHDIRWRSRARAKRDKVVADKVGPMRKWSEVTGICLHQTAVEMSPTEKRWESLGAHIGITRLADIMWVHDFDRIVYHGNLWNDGCIGIEIDGKYEGIVGDSSTLWDGDKPSKLTDSMLATTNAAIRWVCKMVEARGGKIRALVAHRQSKASRPHDPGQEIWQRVALPMSAELELKDGGDGFFLGDGRPIPTEWDGERTSDYWERPGE